MYYKLVGGDLTTYVDFQWEINKWFRIPDEDRGCKELSSKSWFHCYDSLPLVEFLAALERKRLFEISVRGRKATDTIKCGFTMMRLDMELDYPKIALHDLINVTLLCANATDGKPHVSDMALAIKELASLHAKESTLVKLCESLIHTCTFYVWITPIIREYMHSRVAITGR